MKHCYLLVIGFFASLFLSSTALAHSGSTAFIELDVEDNQAKGGWWIALKDIQAVVGLDENFDDQITVREFKQKRSNILGYAQSHLSVTANTNACDIQWAVPLLSRLDDGVYAHLPIAIRCAEQLKPNQINYSALYQVDDSHRVIVNLQNNDNSSLLIGSPLQPQLSWDFSLNSAWQNIVIYVEQGVIHILEGYDHLLFLMALLVPIVFARKTRQQVNQQISQHANGTIPSGDLNLRLLVISLLKVVTAFTVGHSITLILATVFSISPPSAWVESLIAISVVIAGINIVLPLFRESSWRVAALFGLIHGFGFASVLAELSLDRSTLALSLFSFNVGVELGQLLVVLLATPVLILFAKSSSIMPLVARYSAASIAVVIGSVWVLDRIPI